MEKLSIGLVGCGGMGLRHVRALEALRRIGADHLELTAVCDTRLSAAEQAADLAEELLGNRPATFTDHEKMIASGNVQALDIVTGPAFHHVIAVPALLAGLHVICEKPLGLTVRASRAIVEAAELSGTVLATAENYRRDGGNRLARAVIEEGLLGELHCMVEFNLGGSDEVIVSPWRHLREAGPIALDMGVHYIDLFRYYLGDLHTVCGRSFVAEPRRRLSEGDVPTGITEDPPGFIRATGDDSLVALFLTTENVAIQCAYVPSGPGRHWTQRSVHGRNGSMSVPRDRSGGPVIVDLGDRGVLSGRELRLAAGSFELDGVSASFFGSDGTEYDLPFSFVDAATIAIELDDFVSAVADKRRPEVDGLDGLLAVAGVWAVAESRECGSAVRLGDVASGAVSAAQVELDMQLGLLQRPKAAGE